MIIRDGVVLIVHYKPYYLGMLSNNILIKMIYINNGTEIVTKVKEFQEHFEKEGTPIMIGGGVYAYTMLGINYN